MEILSVNVPSFAVHRDILRMAQSEEKRERIKWFYARTVFFHCSPGSLREGLALARQCQHVDARFLVSLFATGDPECSEDAANVFLPQGDEPRCLCWAAQAGAEPRDTLLERSAWAGYAWGQALHGINKEDSSWLEIAAAGGEPEAMDMLARYLDPEDGDVIDGPRSRTLFREAAMLGDSSSQFVLSSFFPHVSVERFVWLRRAACDGHLSAYFELVEWAEANCAGYNASSALRRNMFEVGQAISVVNPRLSALHPSFQAFDLYHRCCGKAQQSLMCWLWLARQRQLAVAKDVRLLIADLVWDVRDAWLE